MAEYHKQFQWWAGLSKMEQLQYCMLEDEVAVLDREFKALTEQNRERRAKALRYMRTMRCRGSNRFTFHRDKPKKVGEP